MTGSERDSTRVIRSWLEEGVDRIPERVLDAVEALLPQARQRRVGRLGRAWAMLSRRTVGYGIAAAVIVGAATLGAAIYLPQAMGTGPTPGPTPEPRVLPQDEAPIAPGSYMLEGFPVRVVFDVPAGFKTCSFSVTEQGICSVPRAPGLSLLIVENVVADRCSKVPHDPPTDSVEEIVAAISSLDGFEATPAVDVSISGFSGKKLVVTAPNGFGCELFTWASPQRTNGVGRGEVNELTILEIDGVRVMVAIAYFPSDPPPPTLAILRGVVESIRIEQ